MSKTMDSNARKRARVEVAGLPTLLPPRASPKPKPKAAPSKRAKNGTNAAAVTEQGADNRQNPVVAVCWNNSEDDIDKVAISFLDELLNTKSKGDGKEMKAPVRPLHLLEFKVDCTALADADVKCYICYNFLWDPLQTTCCRAIICSQCPSKNLNPNVCIVCREPRKSDTMLIRPATLLCNILDACPVECACESKHLKVGSLRRHLTQECAVLTLCGCDTAYPRAEYPEHFERCPKANVRCSNCQAHMLRESLGTHLARSCPHVVSECPDCCWVGKRAESGKHSCITKEARQRVAQIEAENQRLRQEVKQLKSQVPHADIFALNRLPEVLRETLHDLVAEHHFFLYKPNELYTCDLLAVKRVGGASEEFRMACIVHYSMEHRVVAITTSAAHDRFFLKKTEGANLQVVLGSGHCIFTGGTNRENSIIRATRGWLTWSGNRVSYPYRLVAETGRYSSLELLFKGPEPCAAAAVFKRWLDATLAL